MTAFRNFSIRSKFLLAVLITVLFSLLIALASIATLSHSMASTEFKDQLQTLVDITAKRSQAALAFRDKRTVTQNLETLSAIESIDLACVYTMDGKLFAIYESVENLSCEKNYKSGQEHIGDEVKFRFVEKMSVKGRDIGHFYLEANLDVLDRRLNQFVYYSGSIILFSALIAYLLALRLQKSLTMPIIKLSKLSKLIGKTRDFSLRAPVYNEDEAGSLAKSFNGLINDIQDSQMQMEEMVVELQEQKQHLESQNEFVENRNKAIKTMFAGASHDLKQPLQAMVLFVNALKDSCTEQQQGFLQKLEMAIQNMKSLFEDLLDVSKLESRLDSVETGPVEIKPLLDNVFHEFDAMAGDKNLLLRFKANDFVVESNARMLERIIRNLLSNSIRYTDKGGVLLACRKSGTNIHIEIWDTGRGIPDESMESIFKSFYQVERKTAEGQQGYGLGLSIVKRLSEKLKHPIEVKSKFGRGTMFRIIVPVFDQAEFKREIPARPVVRAPVEAPVDVPAEVAPTDTKLSALPGDETKVLLIDDDDLIRDSLITLLESWRMNVCAFPSISEMDAFLKANPERPFDVIVSDFQLSETETGLDAIALAKSYLGENMPALIVTGTTDPELLDTIKVAGIRKLKKPVKPAKLRALINHLYAQSQEG